MRECQSVRLSCRRGDRRELGRFLEERAARGWYAERILPNWTARFCRREEEAGDRCRLVTCRNWLWRKKSGETEEVQALRESWEREGWTFGCCFGHTAVFYGREGMKEGEHPVSGEEERRLLLEEEGRLFLRLTLGGVFAAALWAAAAALFWLNQASREEWAELLAVGAVVWLIYTRFWILGALARPGVRRSLREGRETPPRRLPLGEDELRSLCLAGCGIWAASRLYRMGVYHAALAMALGGAAAAACLVWMVRSRRRGRAGTPGGASLGLTLASLALLLTAAFAWPSAGNYRFSLGEDRGTLYFGEAARSLDVLNAEELGWGPWDSVYVRENPTHCCASETLTYTYFGDELAEELAEELDGGFLKLGSGGLAARLRYVGTLEGTLKDVDHWEDFLGLKGLDLDEARKAELIPGAESYEWEDGKEIAVCWPDGRVVLFFLNAQDERSFDLEDGAVRRALIRHLEELS